MTVIYVDSPENMDGWHTRVEPGAIWQDRQLRFKRFFLAVAATAHLPATWKRQDAPRPSHLSRSNARIVLTTLQDADFAPDLVVPSVDGGISIVFKRGDRYADIECFNNGEVLAAASVGLQAPSISPVDMNNLHQEVKRIRAFLQPSESTFEKWTPGRP